MLVAVLLIQVISGGATISGGAPMSTAASPVTHPGVLSSLIVYYGFESDADPQVNEGTKGSPAGCDLTKAGTTTPAHNTTDALVGAGDFTLTKGASDGRFTWNSSTCTEIAFQGDICLGGVVNRSTETGNDRLISIQDGTGDGPQLMVIAIAGCPEGGESQYCARMYLDSTANVSDVSIRTGVENFIGVSCDDTSGDCTMVVNGASANVDLGSQPTRNAIGTGNYQVGEPSNGVDGSVDAVWITDVECSTADLCYLCSCGGDNEEGCTYTGASWAATGKNSSLCNSCTLPASPSTYSGPS